MAIHAWPTWKTIAATTTSYQRLERADLDTAIAELATLRSTLQRATAELRDGKVADAIAEVDAAVSAVFAGKLGTLPSDIVDELAFDRDEVCAKHDERVPCDHIRELHTGYDYAQATKQAIRDMLTTTASELAKALPGADVHTRTVLTKATGEGPAFGEPCGPEELCKWDNRCEHPSNTCEHACSQMAMEPCPGPYRCVSVPSLTGTFCRR